MRGGPTVTEQPVPAQGPTLSYAQIVASLRPAGRLRFYKAGFGRLAFWEQGEGDHAILFLHGNSAGKECFAPAMAAAAAKGYRAVAIDLPGHGESDDAADPDRQYRLPHWADMVCGFMGAEGLQRALVVGWSLGGHLAIEMAGQGAPMAGMLLTGTPPAGPGPDEMGSVFTPSDAAALTGKGDPTDAEIDLYVRALFSRLDPVPPAFRAMAARADGRVRSIGVFNWVFGDEGHHQRSVVARWPHPIAVLHGTEENFFALDKLTMLRWARLWRGRVHQIPGAGHSAFVEAPDRFNALLLEFAADVFAG